MHVPCHQRALRAAGRLGKPVLRLSRDMALLSNPENGGKAAVLPIYSLRGTIRPPIHILMSE